ncbi:methyltransferase domain-containing protein [Candidatus Dependentiae bacterium]|nr:methyltransferase domain-containing protein [Candidatus Dependentiae bacterium]
MINPEQKPQLNSQITRQDRDKKLSDVKLSYLKKYLQQYDILDVGAGRCYYSDWIAEHYPAAHITALDHIPLDVSNLPKEISYHVTDLEKPLYLADKTFNSILAFDIIEHISHEEQLVLDLFRLCKPGGVLIGSVPHDNDKFLPAYNLTFNHRRDMTHKRYYIPETLRQALTRAGFSDITIELQGGASPHVIAEFFPQASQLLVKKCIGLLRKIGIINTKILASDLFFVAHKAL